MQAEDKAWKEYKLSRFEGRELSHDENLMYHQCFIAGYRAAEQGMKSDVCPRCEGKKIVLDGLVTGKCLQCNGTGKRQ